MSEQIRKPGPVKEETVAVGSEVAEGVAVTEKSGMPGSKTKTKSDHSERSENITKNKSAVDKRKPVPVNEPTKAAPEDSSPARHGEHGHLNEKRGSRLFIAFVSFISLWLLYATIVSLVDAWNTSIWLAVPLTIITLVFISILARLIWRERRAIQSIDRIQQTQRQLTRYINEDSTVGVHETLKPVLNAIKNHYPEEYRQFDEARHDRKTVSEYLSLLDNVVLSRLDKDVDDAINKATLSISGLVAISPHPALDAFMVMFRANMLLREISRIYGLEITGLSSLYLFKHTIVSAVTAAGIEEIGSMVLEEIGANLTEKSVKIVMEGMVSASRMYRLGKITKKITRPISVES
ncbi:MAG: DUF697 domain-containing protein [Gammaproteobacteria bacterium]|nr:DUF697 domain-containing protein [Gammaproteobacteria bacterium]